MNVSTVFLHRCGTVRPAPGLQVNSDEIRRLGLRVDVATPPPTMAHVRIVDGVLHCSTHGPRHAEVGHHILFKGCPVVFSGTPQVHHRDRALDGSGELIRKVYFHGGRHFLQLWKIDHDHHIRFRVGGVEWRVYPHRAKGECLIAPATACLDKARKDNERGKEAEWRFLQAWKQHADNGHRDAFATAATAVEDHEQATDAWFTVRKGRGSIKRYRIQVKCSQPHNPSRWFHYKGLVLIVINPDDHQVDSLAAIRAKTRRAVEAFDQFWNERRRDFYYRRQRR